MHPLAQFFFNPPTTPAAILRRIGGVDKDDLTTGTCSLVQEIVLEESPTTIQNAFAQVVVTHHIADCQIFQRHPVAILHQRRTQFVQIIAALVGDVQVLALHRFQCLVTLLATFLLARQRGSEPAVSFVQPGSSWDSQP